MTDTAQRSRSKSPHESTETPSKKTYHRLVVWREAHQLVLAIYDVTKSFPTAEMYGLTAQMRRAAASVAMNIVEGQARGSDRELMRFLAIASGSLAEVEYQLELVRDLKYVTPEQYKSLEESRGRVGYLLRRFIDQLRDKLDNSS